MDFLAVILFVVLYHIRPHEWIGLVRAFRPAMLAMLMGLYGTVTRPQGFRVGLFFQTPHDWLMLAYLAWIVLSSPTPIGTWKSCYSLFLYYFVIVLALSSIERLRSFFSWWCNSLLWVSAMAILSMFGFDPTYSADVTEGVMKGRLVLNLSIFENPNALGHTLVPAFALLYFLYFWNRFFTWRFLVVPGVALVAWCVYETQSKGAFLSAFVTLLAVVTFRRPLSVKVLVVVFAVTMGWAAVQTLPRMGELDKPRADGGIQGRLWVFRWGLDTYRRTQTGVGWQQFEEGFARESGFLKAPHSTYVAIGAELGWPGLLLFVSLLYTGFKTLITAKTRDDEEERVRRILFVLLLSFAVSSWMVGWSRRASFFMVMAAIAAFHRHLLGMNDIPAEQGKKVMVNPRSKPLAGNDKALQPAMSTPQNITPTPAATPAGATAETAKPALLPGLSWNKLKWYDYILISAALQGVVRFWAYIIRYL